MKLRLFLFSIYVVLFVTLALTILIIININPFESPFWMIVIFYLSLLLFWTALFALIGFYMRVWATNREVIFSHLGVTIRHAMLVSLIIVGLLFLQQLRVLNWWVAVLFVAATGLIELFFKSKSVEKGLK